MQENMMSLGTYQFSVDEATFQHTGNGLWNFDFKGRCLDSDSEVSLFPYGFRLYTEEAPLQLELSEPFQRTELYLPKPFDEASGEPLFGFKVMEEHDVFELRLQFLQKKSDEYLIEITATVSDSVLGRPAPCVCARGRNELAKDNCLLWIFPSQSTLAPSFRLGGGCERGVWSANTAKNTNSQRHQALRGGAKLSTASCESGSEKLWGAIVNRGAGLR
jgi:hypothetical protein